VTRAPTLNYGAAATPAEAFPSPARTFRTHTITHAAMAKRRRAESIDEGEVERCRRASCDACSADMAASSGSSRPAPLKKKRNRVRPTQLPVLESAFEENASPNTEQRREIARLLCMCFPFSAADVIAQPAPAMCERQLQIWFQNRWVSLVIYRAPADE
jgi:hypothetical protein